MVAGAAGEAAGVWASVVGLGVSTGVVEVFSTGEDVVSGGGDRDAGGGWD